MTPGPIEQEPRTPTPMENAGVYLKDLRRARKLTQCDLAEAVEVGRGTIERLESGDDRISIGTVLQVFQALGASPCHYYDLATAKASSLNEVYQQRAVIHGVTAYVRALAERKQVPPAVLGEVMHTSFADNADGAAYPDALSVYALLWRSCISMRRSPTWRQSLGR